MSQSLIMSFRPDAAEMCLGIHPDGLVKDLTRRLPKADCISGWESPDGTEGMYALINENLGVPDGWKLIFIMNGKGQRLWEVGKSIAIKPKRHLCAVGRVMCTGLRVEHVRDITEEDAKREGMEEDGGPHPIFSSGKEWYATARDAFSATWQALYPTGPKSWESNPLVVVIEFRPLREGEE